MMSLIKSWCCGPVTIFGVGHHWLNIHHMTIMDVIGHWSFIDRFRGDKLLPHRSWMTAQSDPVLFHLHLTLTQNRMEMATLTKDNHLTHCQCLKYKTWFGFWNDACFIWYIHEICVNLCHLLFLCHYIWFWLVQQYLKTDPGSADRHIVTLLQPVVESGLGTCAPSTDPPHIVTLLCWARQCNGGEESSKC